MAKNVLYPTVFALFFLSASSAATDEIDMSRAAKNKEAISVFVEGFINESGKSEVSAEDFKKYFEDALLKRKAVKFKIAKNPDSSDFRISGTIKKYQYLKEDPITTYASPSGLILDAVTTENYVAMDVEFTVSDTKNGKIIWKDRASAFIKKKMTPEESVPLIYDKVARTFLWKCFGKSK